MEFGNFSLSLQFYSSILFLFPFFQHLIRAVMLNTMIFIFSFSINITPTRGSRHSTTTVHQSDYITLKQFHLMRLFTSHQVRTLTSQLNNFPFPLLPLFILSHFFVPHHEFIKLWIKFNHIYQIYEINIINYYCPTKTFASVQFSRFETIAKFRKVYA